MSIKSYPFKIFAFAALIVFMASCGGGGNSSSTPSEEETTRLLTGKIVASDVADANANFINLSLSGSCEGISKVIAYATDGTTVEDDALDDCIVELNLVVGKSYAILFVNDAEEFVAVLVFSFGSVFDISSGELTMDLGDITIASGQATFSGNILEFLDSDNDGIIDQNDDSPCGDESCEDHYACSAFGYADSDDNGVCDEWQDRIPSSGDMTGGDDEGDGDGDGGGTTAGGITADHSVVSDFEGIPTSYISQAITNLKIFYGHTSHGSQLVTGMEMLQSATYNWSGMTIHEEGIDLGNPDRTTWATTTRTWLNAHPEYNVVIWSWCGQVSGSSESDINTYLSLMDSLETDYPSVTFIYMTGHTDGSGESGTLRTRNRQIRTWCQENDKALFDFEDIESFDPDGTYYANIADDCSWCSAWCGAHACPACGGCAHSHCFNCYQKGKAFWWMLARLAGWSG